MTRPRIVDPGATLALSRRTTRRHFLLHPDEARQMEQVYWYCLAYAAKLARRVTAAGEHRGCPSDDSCNRSSELTAPDASKDPTDVAPNKKKILPTLPQT
jgi:hypothetical protein